MEKVKRKKFNYLSKQITHLWFPAEIRFRKPAFIDQHLRRARFSVECNCCHWRCQNHSCYWWDFCTGLKNVKCSFHSRIKQLGLKWSGKNRLGRKRINIRKKKKNRLYSSCRSFVFQAQKHGTWDVATFHDPGTSAQSFFKVSSRFDRPFLKVCWPPNYILIKKKGRKSRYKTA